MKTKLIAIVTAGAIAMTSITAAPVQADQADDLARFLIGAAILGIVVNEVNKSNTNATVTTNRRHKVYKPNNRRHVKANQNKPRRCLRQRWTNHGWKKFYAKRCMQDFGWHKHQKNGRWHNGRQAHR
jgi:hypothetical protein